MELWQCVGRIVFLLIFFFRINLSIVTAAGFYMFSVHHSADMLWVYEFKLCTQFVLDWILNTEYWISRLHVFVFECVYFVVCRSHTFQIDFSYKCFSISVANRHNLIILALLQYMVCFIIISYVVWSRRGKKKMEICFSSNGTFSVFVQVLATCETSSAKFPIWLVS